MLVHREYIDKVDVIDGEQVVGVYCGHHGEEFGYCFHLKSEHEDDFIEKDARRVPKEHVKMLVNGVYAVPTNFELRENEGSCQKCKCDYFHAAGVLTENGRYIPLGLIYKCDNCEKYYAIDVSKFSDSVLKDFDYTQETIGKTVGHDKFYLNLTEHRLQECFCPDCFTKVIDRQIEIEERIEESIDELKEIAHKYRVASQYGATDIFNKDVVLIDYNDYNDGSYAVEDIIGKLRRIFVYNNWEC